MCLSYPKFVGFYIELWYILQCIVRDATSKLLLSPNLILQHLQSIYGVLWSIYGALQSLQELNIAPLSYSNASSFCPYFDSFLQDT